MPSINRGRDAHAPRCRVATLSVVAERSSRPRRNGAALPWAFCSGALQVAKLQKDSESFLNRTAGTEVGVSRRKALVQSSESPIPEDAATFRECIHRLRECIHTLRECIHTLRGVYSQTPGVYSQTPGVNSQTPGVYSQTPRGVFIDSGSVFIDSGSVFTDSGSVFADFRAEEGGTSIRITGDGSGDAR